MKAKTVRLEYRLGERITTDGVKGHWGGKFEGDTYFKNAGYGVGQAFVPSLLVLHTMYRGKKLAVRIDRFFKERLGRLIESRRARIRLAMPEEVSIQRLKKKEVVTDPMDGDTVAEFIYVVVASDLEAWLARVTNFTKDEVGAMKKILHFEKEEEKEQQIQEEERVYGPVLRRFERARQQRQCRWRKKMDTLIAQEGSKYLKATFTIGQHRQTGEGQFEFQKDDKLYILRRQDSHVEPKGEEYVSIDRELVPGHVYLVRKEYCY